MRTDYRSRIPLNFFILLVVLADLGIYIGSPCYIGAMRACADEVVATQEKNAASKAASEVPIERKTAKAKELSDAFRAAAEKGLPSVVTVYARQVEKGEENEVELLDILEDPSENHNIGSGVIITADGLIVTNHHVVDKCNRVRVRLPDGREYLGTDIKSDKSSDLAILSIATTKKLSSVTLGDSNTASIGDWVLAIGSPFAIEQTVSAGIISGKSRDIMRGLLAGQLLQTDAAINPGNSGGALLNLDGELIGINSAIASTSGVFEGVGFAIPVNRVKWIVSELRANGKVRRATMGVRVAPLPAEVAEQLDLPARSGALVVGLRDGYPAEKAGLKKGDVILKLADQSVQSPVDLNAIVEQLPIGQPQSVVILREGKRVDLTISLIAKRE